MKSIVTLKKTNSNEYITVELSLFKSQGPNIKSSLQAASQYILLSDGSIVAWQAAESASFSGVFYAWRKLGDENYTVNIDSVFGEIGSADLTVCAMASSIAVLYGTEHKEIAVDSLLENWSLAEYRSAGIL